MRFTAWSVSVSVLMFAFPMTMRCARAGSSEAIGTPTLIESARSGDVAPGRLAVPIPSTKEPPVWDVKLPKRTKTGLGGTLFRPKAPNIHTRPAKKKSSWWPFGKK
jgi:hypothetical protein